MSAAPRFVIVAPSAADNSLGRALSVAATCELLGDVEVLAPEDGPLWVGATAWSIPVRCAPRAELQPAVAAACRAAADPLLISIKPLPASLGIALRVSAQLGTDGARLVVDLDEDDVELRWSSLRSGGPRTRLRRHWRYLRTPLPGHPLVVGRLLRRGVRRADLVTTSSRALGDAVVPPGRPSFVLPHARAPRPFLAPAPAQRLRIGFFGTLRRYKGVDTLIRLLRARPDIELHLLGDDVPGELALPDLSDRVVVHPHRGPQTLEEAYGEADIIVLPQDPAARQTLLQLPAKLVDAMMFGRPVIATDTPPIREIGGDGVLRVAAWNDLDAVLAQIDRLGDPRVREEIGRAVHADAHSRLTTTALAQGLAAALRL
jgi:glycosyltransferase involved in cell wall biosynthesis